MNLHLQRLHGWRKKAVLQILFIFSISFSFAQRLNISGRVTDVNGPLEKVSVSVLGSGRGTTTNANGEFRIGAEKGAVLLFTYLGFDEKRVTIDGPGELEVSLTQSQNALNDVVVVGYGTKKKVNVTGSLSTVSSKELENRPITNVADALQGTMAGVTVVQNSGQPGKDEGTIRVRGIGTLGNSDAMVVVDGMVSTLNDVNPNDIESITVLKDAASASIYGSRAANGVILVTTKKGKAGKTVMHYNAYVGKQQATRLPKYLPSWQASSFYNEALINEGKTPRYTDEEIQKFKDGSDPDNYPNTDWLGLFYNGSGFQQSHYLDISGGSEKTQNMLSLGYFSQDGIVHNTGFQRYTTRYKVTTKLGSRFTVNGNLAYTYSNFKEPLSVLNRGFQSLIHGINRIGSVVPYQYSNGYYGYNDEGNPVVEVNNGGLGKTNMHYLKGIVDGDLEIIKGLHFKPMVGYQLSVSQSKNYLKDLQYYDWTTGAASLYQGPNSLTDYNDFTSVITLQGLLQYDKKWGDHELGVLAGYSQEYTAFSDLQGYRKGFLNNSLSELNAGPVAGQQATGSAYEIALQSFFGRVNYDYKNKYLLEANIREDGSSRFADNNRWGIYPSFSAGWRISEEDFFDPVRDVMTDLKLRGSWGKLGNQNLSTIQNSSGIPIGNYPYIATIASGQNYAFGNAASSGVAPVNGANPQIQWESTTSTDIGLDAAFLKGKITLTADYFIRKTNNLLLNIPVGGVYGFNGPVQNGGSIQNSGFEFELGYHGSVHAVTYNLAANASFIRNRITDLKNTDPIINDFTFLEVGYPINSFYGYQAEGLFQSQDQVAKHATQSGGIIAPGDIMYKDQNGDGVIDGNDRVDLGTYFPKMTYGFSAGLGWKGFDLTLFLQGAAGVKGLVRDVVLGQLLDQTGKPTTAYLNHWTPENTNASFPRLWNSYTQNDPDYNNSSFWVRNAGYLRLKNLQVGYTLSSGFLNRIGVEKARIYYSGQNIFTSTQFYNWVDPEAPAGETGNTYPQVLVNTIGLNLTF